MLQQRKRMMLYVSLILYPFVLFILIRISSFSGKGLIEFVDFLNDDVFMYPLRIKITENMLPVVTVGTLAYAFAFYLYISSMRNIRYDEEYGSAKWGSVTKMANFYKCHEDMYGMPKEECNIRLTENIALGLDMHRHLKSINTLAIGGTGAGKTRGSILPQLLNPNCNFVVTDPKGEILAKVGRFLKKMGYSIRILDLKNHWKSHCYNPFAYFRRDDDILKFANDMWESMSDKKSQKGEQIWDDQAKNMILSMMMYLYHFAPPEEQNFDMVIRMINDIRVTDDGSDDMSAVKLLFEALPLSDPIRGYYESWAKAKGRTLASILVTVNAKLSIFNLESMKKLTYTDEIHIKDLADKKVAIFCVIPDNDTTYNFIAGTLYSQIFQQLYDIADNVYHGGLPRHVRFLMDEFANIALPDDYEKILSTARSRNISFEIVVQNLQQIEALYEKLNKAIMGNFDEYLFLGSNELDTCKYFSDLLDKETVVMVNYNRTYGRMAGITKNESKIGRELMQSGELRRLNNRYAVLVVRGEDAVIDKKINLKNCINYKELADGKRFKDNIYEWGNHSSKAGASIYQGTYMGVYTPLPETKSKAIAA